MANDEVSLFAETIQSPDHTVRFSEAFANGDISPGSYEKLRMNIVHGTEHARVAIPFFKSLGMSNGAGSSKGKAKS